MWKLIKVNWGPKNTAREGHTNAHVHLHSHRCIHTFTERQKGQCRMGACQHPWLCLLLIAISFSHFLKAQSAAGVQNVAKTMGKGECASVYVGHL